MSRTVMAVIGGIVALTLLGIGLSIAIPALQDSESGADSNYTTALDLSYVVLGLAPVALIIGLFFNRFMGR